MAVLKALFQRKLALLGLIVINAFSDKIPHDPTDAQLLTWVKGNTNSILLGGWMWMLGCVSFVWFANVLRTRLAAVEGGVSPYATVAFAGAVANCVLTTPASVKNSLR